MAGLVATGAWAATPPADGFGPGGGEYLSGQFLIAPPEHEDGPFARSVVFVIHHDANGATGVIVNKPIGARPLPVPPADGNENGGAPDDRATTPVVMLRFGGPVAPDSLLTLHSTEFSVDGTRIIAGIAALSPPRGVIRALQRGDAPEHLLVFSGYAGWAPGQLDAELARGWWHTSPAYEDILFGGNDRTKWHRAMARRPRDL